MHRLFGVNLSGPEFAPWNGQTFPTNADFAYLASKGVNFVRLPVAWEQLQPTLLGSLATTYLNSIKTAIDNGYANGIGVMVDLHNFGAYTASAQWTTTVGYAGNAGIAGTGVSFLGDGTLTSAAFVDVWTKLATALAGRAGLVGYGTMNEPVRSVGTNLVSAPNYFGPNSLVVWFTQNGAVQTIQAVGTNPLGAGYGPAWNLSSGTGFGGVAQTVAVTNVPHTISVYAKCSSGTETMTLTLAGAGSGNLTVTTSWQRFTFTTTPAAGSQNFIITNNAVSGHNFLIANAQVEAAGSASTYAPSPYIPFAQAAVTAIRAVDATTPIHVCGGISFGAASWKMFNYEMALMTGGGLIFEAHQYFDGPQGVGGGGTYSGTYTSYGIDDQSGVQTLIPFTGWATDNGKSIYVGEFSVPNRTTDNDAAWLPLQVNFLKTLYAANIKASMWFYGSNGVQSSNILNVVPVAGVDDLRLTQMLAVGASRLQLADGISYLLLANGIDHLLLASDTSAGSFDLIVTEAKDTAIFTVTTAVSGTLTTTEATDTAAFVGGVIVSGIFATTEAKDTAVFAGSVVAGINATFATTEATDTAAFVGSVIVSGTLTTTEATDTAAFVGNAIVSGTFATTEVIDTAAFAGGALVSGPFATTEAADTAAFVGFGGVSGTLAVTSATDTCAVVGFVGVSGTLARTEATDTAVFNGTVIDTIITSVLAVTEGRDICSFSGVLVFEWVPIVPPDQIWIPTIAATNTWTPVV